MKTAVIVPAYNEAKNIPKILQSLSALNYFTIVVDDGSKDNTTSAALQTIGKGVVLTHEINLGKGAAMSTGCEYAFRHLKVDAIIFMDADNQHDPKELPLFIAELQKGADLVFGTRAVSTDMPLIRKLGNKFASAAVYFLFRSYVPDIPSGYKAMTSKAFKQIQWNASGYEVETEIVARSLRAKLPFSLVQIETIYHDTDKGMTILDALGIACRLLQWKFSL